MTEGPDRPDLRLERELARRLAPPSPRPAFRAEVLARFAATLDYERIPAHTREYAKNLLLDTLACAVAGHQGEETYQVAALARLVDGPS